MWEKIVCEREKKRGDGREGSEKGEEMRGRTRSRVGIG